MDSAVMKRIFDPCYTTKKVGEGTGLGLAMAHGIIKRHGGAITVASKVGEGTTVDLYFPRVEMHTMPEPRDSASLTMGQGRILLVDDEVEVAEVQKEL
jgi:nitrogen-specific signal transduction histidine kinase